jgi:hypothetical protein
MERTILFQRFSTTELTELDPTKATSGKAPAGNRLRDLIRLGTTKDGRQLIRILRSPA